MQLRQTHHILTSFGRRCLRAPDRRGTWRPGVECERELVLRTGATPAMAAQLRAAAERVAEQIKRTAGSR